MKALWLVGLKTSMLGGFEEYRMSVLVSRWFEDVVASRQVMLDCDQRAYSVVVVIMTHERGRG